MHFCSICNNMYYLRIVEKDPNKLIYYCRNCGHEDNSLLIENGVISTYKTSHESQYSHIVNAYTKLDPTLPRRNDIPCPNPLCETNTKEKQKEIIFIRYDNVNMKYLYLCSTCDTQWVIANK